jgi:predicted nucleic acid-binding protein
MAVIHRHHYAGTIDLAEAERAVMDLLDLPIAVHPTAPLLPRGWQLRDNLTTYDACYIAPAETLGCSLLTADTRLARVPGTRCPIEVI